MGATELNQIHTTTAEGCVDAELRETQGQFPPLWHFLHSY
jgi:hypothetical protein